MTDEMELKMHKTDYTCGECFRSYYTEERIHGGESE